MQFDGRNRDEILAGEVTLTFRRWKRRQAVPGNTYRTFLGRIGVDAVEVVTPTDITVADAGRAGASSVDALLAAVGGSPDLPLYRVEFHVVDEPDPRAVLAADDSLTVEERSELDERLGRMDARSSHGVWTRETLAMIGERPGVRAADLAATVGRETQGFKTDVRKLKKLGLTESLEVGYRLSPRGRVYLGL